MYLFLNIQFFIFFFRIFISFLFANFMLFDDALINGVFG